ncbi:hypothetical protein SAMD00019534_096120 [Acytostelium subglobosum LB1]|uniref:hypothetical protein n=1 Tax=Acytostelium subglobosum LB1 TaxID=1410327 RepID=UPI000644A9E8|nr:hypothetical protein SAMD00019534_096120 [Acytostelium subglobosum LB1]GAM26437.1 hypothetical protein SAMD00019534_096120 [Acytostelium subglobosum LB1]|eukprot:XP_012750533.1 hypothetical protein SAMD00019534_096120 [Acytostelium subglobosum LB1]
MQAVVERHLEFMLIEWYFEDIKHYLNNHLSIEFWSHFRREDDDDDKNNTNFISAIDKLHQVFTLYANQLKYLCHALNKSAQLETWIENLQNNLIASLIVESTKAKRFKTILLRFFEREFVSFSKSYIGSIRNRDDDDVDVDDYQHDDDDNIMDMSLNESFTDINVKESSFMSLCNKLNQLNFIIVSEEIFTKILLSKILEHIETKCRDVFDRRLLSPILRWADRIIFKWLYMILSPWSHTTYEQWKMRIEFSIYEYYSDQRISELFNMIRMYPDSTPALHDLALCFQKISIQKPLVNSLKAVFNQRLLHPGANTNDIITTYISTIQAMKIIDPTCFVMDQVAQPIKNYLAKRDDTIRCIVSSFTDENSEMYQEFSRGIDQDEDPQTMFNAGDVCDIYLDDVDPNDGLLDLKAFEAWQPASIESQPNQKIQKYRDNISSLVSIYESTDVFVNEYRLMLSERLLSMTDYDIDREIKNVELLKLRFGESSMHNCEIMIKDMADSKRLNIQIAKEVKNKQQSGDGEEQMQFGSLILSKLFWPSFKEEQFTYPRKMQKQMELFAKEYEAIKAPRKLEWKQHLGFVELEIEIDGQLRPLTVSTLQAAIITMFEDKTRHTLEELATALEVKEDFLKKKMSFWIGQQVLREAERGVYEVVVSAPTADDQNNEMVVDMEEEEEQSASDRQKEEQLKVIDNFIFGMLTNFKALPIDRIHSMLSMFNAEIYTLTIAELKTYLQKLQNDERIELSGGEYRIKK